MMPKISVITPTVRPEGLKLVQKALRRQTFKDFEWLVIAPQKTTLKGFDCTLFSDPPKQPGDYWTIYKAYNKVIKQAKGELIVSWQDYTFADPDCLEKFWFHYQQEPRTLVSAVGNKYSDESFSVKTWQDPRETVEHGTFYPCYFNDIEWNLCSVPKEAVLAVGGWDEELDKYSSLCGLDVLDRLNILGGYDFKLDQTIKSYSLEHGRLPEWEKYSPFNGAYADRRKAYLANPKLKYLK